MKKTYQNPGMRVVIINASRNLLAGSEVSMHGDYNSSNVTIASRKGGFFDDEDEE